MDWAQGIAVEAKAEDHTVQGTEAWKRWRGKGLGSSDAAVLLGVSPWKSITQLYEEKIGAWKPVFGAAQQRAMDRGKELEPVIRRWYENVTGHRFQEGVAEHPVHNFMRASWDGANAEIRQLIEIKAPNAKDHELARMGVVPEKYVAQCQWLMMVSGYELLDYVSFGTDDTYHVVHMIADKGMQKELTDRAIKFWMHVEAKTPPRESDFETWVRPLGEPIDLKDAVPVQGDKTQGELFNEAKAETASITDQEVEGLAAECLKAQEEAKVATARHEALKERMKQILGTKDYMEAGDAVFGFSSAKGAVNYKVIPELIGIDLDQFRGPDTKRFFIKRKGEK